MRCHVSEISQAVLNIVINAAHAIGTGQGLAIAWSTVKERHAGSLTFETRPGDGTTFFIRLPIMGNG